MTIWHITQEVGEVLQQEGEEKRAAVFEDGEAPGGEEVAPELHIEADGVMTKLQRAKEKLGMQARKFPTGGKNKLAGTVLPCKTSLFLAP